MRIADVIVFQSEETNMTDAMTNSDTPETVSPVAHYTDAEALIKILTKGVLWASDARYLNDRAEVEYGRSLVREILTRRMERADEVQRAKCETLRDEAKETFTFSIPLVTCFSRSIDSLGQWRGYGTGRMRFALEFEEAALRAIVKEQHFQLVDCVYEKEKQVETLEMLIDEELRLLTESKPLRRPDGSRLPNVGRWISIEKTQRRYPGYAAAQEEMEKSVAEGRPMAKEHVGYLYSMVSGWTSFQWKLAKVLMRLKHPSFVAEDEVRAAKEHDEDASSPELMFRGTERAIVPYTELRFRTGKDRGALRAVRVGPGINFDETKPVVERLLFQNAYYGVTVEPSRCTYRD